MPRQPRLFIFCDIFCRVASGEVGFDDPLEAEEFVPADLTMFRHGSSLRRWIRTGLRKQAEDDVSRERIDSLDRRITASARMRL